MWVWVWVWVWVWAWASMIFIKLEACNGYGAKKSSNKTDLTPQA